jgi:hypothetical protein
MAYTVEQMGPGVLLHLGRLLLTLYAALVAFGLFGLLPAALIAAVPLRRFLRAVAESATILGIDAHHGCGAYHRQRGGQLLGVGSGSALGRRIWLSGAGDRNHGRPAGDGGLRPGSAWERNTCPKDSVGVWASLVYLETRERRSASRPHPGSFLMELKRGKR